MKRDDSTRTRAATTAARQAEADAEWDAYARPELEAAGIDPELVTFLLHGRTER